MTKKKDPKDIKPSGRPTDFREEYIETAYKLCLLGSTDKQMADIFRVTEQTLNDWKKKHPKFLESLRKGKDLADGEIAKALFHRAKGYKHPDVHVSNIKGEIVLTPLTKYYPPDTKACEHWLNNRQGKNWRTRQEVVVDDISITKEQKKIKLKRMKDILNRKKD